MTDLSDFPTSWFHITIFLGSIMVGLSLAQIFGSSSIPKIMSVVVLLNLLLLLYSKELFPDDKTNKYEARL